MKNYIINFIISLNIFLLISSCDWYYEHQFFDIRFGIIELINKNQFEKVSDLFYYPATYSNEELDIKKQTVVKKFKLLTSKLGYIKYTNNHDPVSKYKITIQSIDRKEYKIFTHGTGGIFAAQYSKAGNGYFSINFFKELSGLELYEVEYKVDSLDEELIELFTTNGINVERIYTTAELKLDFDEFYDVVLNIFCDLNIGGYENNLEAFYTNDVEKILSSLRTFNSKNELYQFIRIMNYFDLIEPNIDNPDHKKLYNKIKNKYKIMSEKIWIEWQNYKNN